MSSSVFRSAAALGLAALVVGAAPASATVVNGTFDAGSLTGWSIGGDAAALDGTAVLTTSYGADDDGGVNLNQSGQAPLAAGGDLEVFAGLVAGSLDEAAQQAYEGSALQQTFTVSAGDQLSFDWRLLSNDTAMPDLAFVAVDAQLTTLALSPQAAAGGAALGYAGGTGWASFTYTFVGAGSHTLVLGVADRGDYIGTSALQVDNVLLTPVPEGDGAVLAALGAGLLGWQRRARRRVLRGA